MPDASDQRLLELLLDSWDRNNTILVNLLRAIPEGGLEIRPMEGSCRWSRRCSIAGAADGRLVVEATMGSLVVVVVGPGLEF
jgi:hypothetical protein